MGIDLGRFKRDRGEEWVDWLTDDPVPASIRQKMRTQAVREAARPMGRRPVTPVTAQQPSEAANTAKTVSINITVPKIKLQKPRIVIPQILQDRKVYIIGGVVVASVIVGTGLFMVLGGQSSDNGDTPAVLAESNEKANFAYTLPKGEEKNIDTAVRYDAQRKVVNYQDSIGGIPITISQQPLPESLKEDTANKVKKLAEDFSATKALTTATPTAYLGTAIEGPQTVIFSKNDLLIFIQSTKMIDDRDWAEYVTNLR